MRGGGGGGGGMRRGGGTTAIASAPAGKSVVVSVRVRPILGRDPAASAGGDQQLLSLDRLGQEFDTVHGPAARQADVYADCCAPLVNTLFEAGHGCLFAFGQTGAGKTFSMVGPEGGRAVGAAGGGDVAGSQADGLDGVLPRAAAAVFERAAGLEAASEGGEQYQLRLSFVEVHRERLFDLLAGHRVPLKLRERPDGSFWPEGAVNRKLTSAAELLAAVADGASRRATAATGVHAHSSRSHALLTLTLERRTKLPPVNGAKDRRPRVACISGRLSLVDLAGSEGMARAHGQRRQYRHTAKSGAPYLSLRQESQAELLIHLDPDFWAVNPNRCTFF